MKIRQGFVSNSSSSSFIITADKTEDGMIKVKPEDIGDVIRTKEDLDKKYQEYLCEDETLDDLDSYHLKRYNSFLKKIENGKVIILGCIERGSEEDIERFFETLNFKWEED